MKTKAREGHPLQDLLAGMAKPMPQIKLMSGDNPQCPSSVQKRTNAPMRLRNQILQKYLPKGT